jgi:hypothetical protein
MLISPINEIESPFLGLVLKFGFDFGFSFESQT